MLVRLAQLLKIPVLSEVIPSGIVTLVKLQLVNASFPIEVTLSGIVILVRL